MLQLKHFDRAQQLLAAAKAAIASSSLHSIAGGGSYYMNEVSLIYLSNSPLHIAVGVVEIVNLQYEPTMVLSWACEFKTSTTTSNVTAKVLTKGVNHE